MPFELIEDPVSDDERKVVANQCVADLNLPMPAVIDRIDNLVNLAYGALPDRLYLVDKNGKVAYAGKRGPRGFKPDELETAILAELGQKDGGR